jgi:hypothetical protein
MKSLTSKPYADPVWKAYLLRKHAELCESSKLTAKIQAADNNPPFNAPALAAFIRFIHAAYSTLTSENHNYHQADTQILAGAADLKSGKKLEQDHQKTLDELEAKINTEKGKHSHSFPILQIIKFLAGITLAFLLCAGEIAFLMLSLQCWGKGIGTAFYMACAIAISMLIISHLGNKLLNLIRSIKLKKLIVRACIIAFVLFFLGLASFRSNYVEKTTGEHLGMISQVWFILLNFILFGALFLTGKFIVIPASHDAKEGMNEFLSRIKLRRLKRKHALVARLKEEHATDLRDTLSNRMSLISNAKSFEILINSMYQENVAVYCQANFERRADGIMPKCFSQEPPELPSFYSHFNNNPQS